LFLTRLAPPAESIFRGARKVALERSRAELPPPLRNAMALRSSASRGQPITARIHYISTPERTSFGEPAMGRGGFEPPTDGL
jgi:hypothetical protein